MTTSMIFPADAVGYVSVSESESETETLVNHKPVRTVNKPLAQTDLLSGYESSSNIFYSMLDESNIAPPESWAAMFGPH